MVLTLILGTKTYLGTGEALIAQAIDQGRAAPQDCFLKLLLTALTLGAGLKGGEIVPCFAIGASFGCVVGPLLGLPAPYAAAVGMVALFCGVTNCPLTALMLGFEVFFFCNPGAFSWRWPPAFWSLGTVDSTPSKNLPFPRPPALRDWPTRRAGSAPVLVEDVALLIGGDVHTQANSSPSWPRSRNPSDSPARPGWT